MSKKGKNRQKPKDIKSNQDKDKCPRCHGTGKMKVIEKLKNGGERRDIVECDLCYGFGKRN